MSGDMWRYLLHNPQMQELVTAVKALAPELPVAPKKPLDLQPCIDRINRENLEYMVLMAKYPPMPMPEQEQPIDLLDSVLAAIALLLILLMIKSGKRR